MKKHEKHQILKKRLIFSKGPIRLVDCDVKHPDGRVLSRQILEHPGCVVIIPRLKNGKYVLVKQYRYPLDKHLWEFPAGGKERGESFPQAARRELMEEIGLRPRCLKKLAAFYPTPGVSGEKMHLFLAWDLHPKYAEKDEDEDFEVGHFSLRQLEKLISKGKIADGKTVAGCYYIKNYKNVAKKRRK